jgi:hypothetical protein
VTQVEDQVIPSLPPLDGRTAPVSKSLADALSTVAVFCAQLAAADAKFSADRVSAGGAAGGAGDGVNGKATAKGEELLAALRDVGENKESTPEAVAQAKFWITRVQVAEHEKAVAKDLAKAAARLQAEMAAGLQAEVAEEQARRDQALCVGDVEAEAAAARKLQREARVAIGAVACIFQIDVWDSSFAM